MGIKDKTAAKLPSIPSEISKETDVNHKKIYMRVVESKHTIYTCIEWCNIFKYFFKNLRVLNKKIIYEIQMNDMHKLIDKSLYLNFSESMFLMNVISFLNIPI